MCSLDRRCYVKFCNSGNLLALSQHLDALGREQVCLGFYSRLEERLNVFGIFLALVG